MAWGGDFTAAVLRILTTLSHLAMYFFFFFPATSFVKEIILHDDKQFRFGCLAAYTVQQVCYIVQQQM